MLGTGEASDMMSSLSISGLMAITKSVLRVKDFPVTAR
jgi:hypothetical protein